MVSKRKRWDRKNRPVEKKKKSRVADSKTRQEAFEKMML